MPSSLATGHLPSASGGAAARTRAAARAPATVAAANYAASRRIGGLSRFAEVGAGSANRCLCLPLNRCLGRERDSAPTLEWTKEIHRRMSLNRSNCHTTRPIRDQARSPSADNWRPENRNMWLRAFSHMAGKTAKRARVPRETFHQTEGILGGSPAAPRYSVWLQI